MLVAGAGSAVKRNRHSGLGVHLRSRLRRVGSHSWGEVVRKGWVRPVAAEQMPLTQMGKRDTSKD